MLAFAIHGARDARALTAQSDEVLVRANELERKVVDLETGLRGFAITRDPVFLRPMMAAQRQIPDDLIVLRRLTRGDAGQERRARAVEIAVWTYARHWLVPALKLHRSDSGLAAQMWAIIGRTRMEAIRARFTAFQRGERALRAGRVHRAERYERAVVVLLVLAAAGLVSGWALSARRFRRHAAAASADLAAELAAVRARSEELAGELARREELDPLTGLATRRAFLERLEQECAAARRHGGELSLVVLDVAGLGRINAERGLAVGDEVLVQVARLCSSHVRTGDAVARIGGDELALLLPRTPLRRAEALAGELRARLRAEATAVDAAFGTASATHRADAGALLAAATPQRPPAGVTSVRSAA